MMQIRPEQLSALFDGVVYFLLKQQFGRTSRPTNPLSLMHPTCYTLLPPLRIIVTYISCLSHPPHCTFWVLHNY